jgi:hypothetical protein
MIRRSTIRILLSLLLLISQQMAIAHAVSHWGDRVAPAAQGQQSGEFTLAEALALDQICSDCLSFAQIGGMVGSEPFRFAPADARLARVCIDASHAACARTICAYHSRAPPVAI